MTPKEKATIAQGARYIDLLSDINKRLQALNSNHYHSFDAEPSRHIIGMYERAIEIATHEKLSPQDMHLLSIAVLLHDIEQGPDHEERSAALARSVMESFGYSQKDRDTVAEAIESTKLLRDPKTGKLYREPNGRISEILLDCDIYPNALPEEDFFEVNEALREELGMDENPEWWKTQIQFMEDHEWFTPFAREFWEPQKQANLSAVKRKFRQALLTNEAA